jgi:hypothetical protein
MAAGRAMKRKGVRKIGFEAFAHNPRRERRAKGVFFIFLLVTH